MANRDRILRTEAARQAAKVAFIRAEKARRGCELCGERDPVVLEFDHIDQSTKSRSLIDARNKSFRKLGWPNLIREIAKCRVLCANCHRRETYRLAQRMYEREAPPALF